MCIPLSIYIDVLSVAGEHARLAQVWKQLKDDGLQFDSHNWNHLVIALVRGGEPERAFDIVENVILRYQAQVRRMFGTARDQNPDSPLTLDLPPPEEGDLPPHRSEAPLHDPLRRAKTVRKSQERLRRSLESDSDTGDDFAHDLHLLHQISPLWDAWRPHGATLTVLGQVLDHLESGRLIQALRPGVDAEFEQAALDMDELKVRTERAALVLGRIYDRFPQTVKLIRHFLLMRRTRERNIAEARKEQGD